MAKLVNYSSGPISPDPNQPPAIDGHKEVIVTPNPKTKAQRQGNTNAQGLKAAAGQQEQNAYAPSKLTRTQKTARRKQKRDHKYKAVQADLAAGRITPEEAKKHLPRRQPRGRSD
jgi:hypothetical protein